MKQLSIPEIVWDNPKVEELSVQFENFSVPSCLIDVINWEAYPYCPEVSFRIAHNSEAILLNYRINESDVKAVFDCDNGRVWEDSCVEFFISFNEESYYNIECNCIGKLLIAKGSGRERRVFLPEVLLKNVGRWSSLGELPIENHSGDWEISLVVPKEIFYQEKINTFTSVKAKGNFYKCGDCLQTPHFLSWNPIQSETPDFHRPDFFGQLQFE